MLQPHEDGFRLSLGGHLLIAHTRAAPFVFAGRGRLDCGVHTGTHVDAPHHFLNDGRTVESLSLDSMIGPASVVQIPEDVEAMVETVAFRTGRRPGRS